MRPLGLFFVFLSVIVGYEGVRGRSITAVGTDLKDVTVSLIKGDVKGAQEALTRAPTLNPTYTPATGNAASLGSAGGSAVGNAASIVAGNNLLNEAMKLGSAAKGYRWGGVGPVYYDCSGLVWRAVQKAAGFKGPRFTTFNEAIALKPIATEVKTPQRGDIAVWQIWSGGHTGIMTDAYNVYSARSPKSGIGTTLASVFTGIYAPPRYFRLK
jgi:hypothetical protein